MNRSEVERRLRAAGLPTKPVVYVPSETRKAITANWRTTDSAAIGAGTLVDEPTFPGARQPETTGATDIREWAIAKGLRCSRKGPIPKSTRVAYSEAHYG